MREMDLCVIMTKEEWDEVIIEKKLRDKKDGCFLKDDVILHDGKPYLCMKDTTVSNPIGYSGDWKAIHVVK